MGLSGAECRVSPHTKERGIVVASDAEWSLRATAVFCLSSLHSSDVERGREGALVWRRQCSEYQWAEPTEPANRRAERRGRDTPSGHSAQCRGTRLDGGGDGTAAALSTPPLDLCTRSLGDWSQAATVRSLRTLTLPATRSGSEIAARARRGQRDSRGHGAAQSARLRALDSSLEVLQQQPITTVSNPSAVTKRCCHSH